jgi:chemotaxis methyl-accepting protein methylase
MPSMSYCMFENTETEMYQVVTAMREAFDFQDLDLNEHEMAAAPGLAVLCRAYLAEYARLFDPTGEEEVEISPYD